MIEPARMLPKGLYAWAGLALLVVALAVLPLFTRIYYVELATAGMIAAMLALSMHLLVGGAGLVSLGHAAFYGLAAYTVYLISPDGAARPVWQTLPVAIAAAGAVAFLVGAISLRTKGFFFLMVTLAFGQMIYFVFHDTKLGGGTDGAYLARPLISAFGYTLELPRRQRPLGPYYFALAQLCVTYLLLVLLLRSLFGRVLEGIRINEHRMAAIGFDTYRYKLIAFTIAGMLAGAAGHMWAMHRGFVNPEIIGWHKSAEALLMILLGGLGSLTGAVVGALAYTALGEISQLITERRLLVEGFVILLVVLILPRGLTGIFRRREPADAPSDAVAAPPAADTVPVAAKPGGAKP